MGQGPDPGVGGWVRKGGGGVRGSFKLFIFFKKKIRPTTMIRTICLYKTQHGREIPHPLCNHIRHSPARPPHHTDHGGGGDIFKLDGSTIQPRDIGKW